MPPPDPGVTALSQTLSPGTVTAALLGTVSATAAGTERRQRLAAIEALHQAGLFRLLLPRSLGGHQSPPVAYLDALGQLAAADASTAWCVAQTSVCAATAAARLPRPVAAALFTHPAALLAWGHGPPGAATPAPGGWIIAGAWSFGTGAHHATWLGGACATPDGPRMMLFPQPEARFTHDWDTIGLRGTGSDSYAVSALFIPDTHTFRFGDKLQPHASGPLYRLPPDALWAAGFAAVALGVAGAMRDALAELARRTTPRAHAATLAQAPATQALLAEATAALRAARALLHQSLAVAHDEAGHHGAATLEARMSLRLAASHALRTARLEGARCHHAAGSAAIFAAGPFERRLRDLNAIAQHIHARDDHFETVGRHMLGLTPDPAFL